MFKKYLKTHSWTGPTTKGQPTEPTPLVPSTSYIHYIKLQNQKIYEYLYFKKQLL
jgi:hypothetical protein